MYNNNNKKPTKTKNRLHNQAVLIVNLSINLEVLEGLKGLLVSSIEQTAEEDQEKVGRSGVMFKAVIDYKKTITSFRIVSKNGSTMTTAKQPRDCRPLNQTGPARALLKETAKKLMITLEQLLQFR